MSKMTDLHKEAMEMLLATSRTFFIPIDRLSPGIKEAVASAYLCMRAIDEIEDDSQMPTEIKINLLQSIGKILKTPFSDEDLTQLFEPYRSELPEVTLRLSDWAKLTPEEVQPAVYQSTAIMAEGMAKWVSKGWVVHTEEELDDYTFYVAGLVGVMLNDLWKWYDGTETDQDLAIAYGRGLQAVNIIRNRDEDLARGVDFFPDGWGFKEMFAYARRNLALADVYIESIKSETVLDFCKIPLALAYATLNAVEAGEEKLTRGEVTKIVKETTGN